MVYPSGELPWRITTQYKLVPPPPLAALRLNMLLGRVAHCLVDVQDINWLMVPWPMLMLSVLAARTDNSADNVPGADLVGVLPHQICTEKGPLGSPLPIGNSETENLGTRLV